MPPASISPYKLYTNWRSTCSARLRLALNLKSIPYTPTYVNLDTGEQHSDWYRAINSSGTVPCLQSPSGEISITQSLAAIEYLDECHAEHTLKLLPSDLAAKAQVRALAYMIACDLQPLTSSRVQRRVEQIGGDGRQWCADTYVKGLEDVERKLKSTSGTYSYKDEITMADVCLMSGVWKAQMLDVDVGKLYPTTWAIYQTLWKMDAVKDAYWGNQPDCPPEARTRSSYINSL